MILAKLALGCLLSAFRGVAGLVLRYPWQAALCASLLAVAWLWNGKGKAEAERDAAIAAKVAQAAEFSAAVEQAERANREARAAVATKTKELADAADDHARDLDAISRRALADRVRQGKGVCASAAPAAGLSGGAQEPAGTDTGGVYFNAAEVEFLRRKEVHSVTCYGWLLSQIDAGLAIPGD